MKTVLAFIAALAFITGIANADTANAPGIIVQEEDGSPTGRFQTIKVTNASLTDNGDGTASVSTTGSSSSYTNLSVSNNLSVNNNLNVTGTATMATINTGTGDFEIGQDLRTTDDVVFASLNTDLGQTEVYLMDHNIRTTDSMLFSNLSVSNDITIVNGKLYVGSIINTSGTGTISNNAGDMVTINDNLSVSGFATQDTEVFDFPLDFDVSPSTHINNTKAWLYSTKMPFDVKMETARLILDLTPSGDLTVALYENATDISTPDVDISKKKSGDSHTINTLVDGDNWFGIKCTGFSAYANDSTMSGVLRVIGERYSET